MKQYYLIAAIVSFICGVLGGVLGVIGDGSVLAALTQTVGYCGAGYYACRYLSA